MAVSQGEEMTDRRDFLKKAAGVVAGVSAGSSVMLQAVSASEQRIQEDIDKYDFLFTRVKFACDRRVLARWSVYPGAERNLLDAFSKVVRCKVKLPPNCRDHQPLHDDTGRCFNAVSDLTDLEKMRKFPFLFMTAEGYYKLDGQRKKNLKQYLQEGGFILMDDCVYKKRGDYFYRSSLKLLGELFEKEQICRVGREHEVFHNVYDLGETGLPYLQGFYHPPVGVFIGERLAAFLSSTDLHCGWTDRRHKWFRKGQGGRHDHEDAIKMGINIIMYAVSH